MKNMSQRIIKVVDSLVFPEHLLDPVLSWQGRLLVGLNLLVLCPLPVFIAIQGLYGNTQMVVISAITLVFCSAVLVMYRYTGRRVLITQFWLILGAGALLATLMHSGGLHSVIMAYLMVLPVMAFVLIDRFWGYVWALVALAGIGLFTAIELAGVMPAPMINETDIPVTVALNLVTVLVYVVGSVVFLDKLNALQKDRLVQQRGSAEAANAAKSQFLANMSHELRTPLNGVLGLTEVLIADEVLQPKQQQTLQTILRSGRGLSQLLDDLLDFSKIEADRVELERLPVDMATLVDDVLALFAERAHDQGIVLHVEVEPDIGWGEGDMARLRQVLLNLFGNAVKFTSDGEVRLRCWREGAYIYVAVQDTGIGIASNQMNRLFEPFVQADTSTTRRFGGSGLGLSISRRLARLMGGDISVDSVLGQGSTFTFWCLLPPCVPPQGARSEPPPLLAMDTLRVMVAEDNLINQEVIRRLLLSMVADVILVKDGAEALQVAQAQSLDLVLMDIHMPGIDGLEATRMLRRAGVAAPIVALTASAFQEDRDAAFLAGVDAFIAKPVSLGALQDVMASVLMR